MGRSLIKILTVSGSPVDNSSTDILLERIAAGFTESLSGSGSLTGSESPSGQEELQTETIKLSKMQIKPCEACGFSPEPKYCVLNDDLSKHYESLVECDCLLIGSPIYFDSVSAQMKLFIDRANCLRPPDYKSDQADAGFVRRIKKQRIGAMVLVGGEKGWFEGARRTIAGFFKWIEVANEGMVVYHSTDFNLAGTVSEDQKTLLEAYNLGKMLAEKAASKARQ